MDSDDYFQDDDFVLDETTLAILDAEEKKYIETTTLPQAQPPLKQPLRQPQTRGRHTPPPAKRQKTQYGWQPIPRSVAVPTTTFGDDDDFDLPEIEVQSDGTYGVASNKSTSGGTAVGSLNGLGTAAVRALQRVPSSGSFTSTPKPPSRSYPNPNTVPPQRVHQPQAGPSTHATRPISRQSSGSGQPVQRHPSQLSSSQLQNGHQRSQHSMSQPRPSQSRSAEQSLRTELEILRAQVEELRKAQEDSSKALKDAQDIRFAKEGEVSILRNGIEKAAEQHSLELAKLKKAKEEADAMHAQAQRQWKEDTERLQTKFTFRIHELETSTHTRPRLGPGDGVTTPHTIRGTSKRNAKKSGFIPPSTPIEVPFQIRQWSNGRAKGNESSSQTHTQTSGRGKGKEREKVIVGGIEVPLSTAQLPGFSCAFDTSTPLRGRAKPVGQTQVKGDGKEKEDPDETPKGKGKGKEIQPEREPFFGSSPVSSPTRPPKPLHHTRFEKDVFRTNVLDGSDVDTGVGDENTSFDVGGAGDVEMVSGDNDGEITPGAEGGSGGTDGGNVGEAIEDFEPINWADEIRQILFVHTYRPHGHKSTSPEQQPQLTLQLLLQTTIPSLLGTPSSQSKSDSSPSSSRASKKRKKDPRAVYLTACTSLLQTLGSQLPSSLPTSFSLPSTTENSETKTVTIMAKSLVEMLDVLVRVEADVSGSALPSLLNLLKLLVVIVPDFVNILLSFHVASASASSSSSPSQPKLLKLLSKLLLAEVRKGEGGDEADDESANVKGKEESQEEDGEIEVGGEEKGGKSEAKNGKKQESMTRATVEETLGLLEVLIWRCPEDLVEWLSTIPHTPKLLASLTSVWAPVWLVSRATRMLTLLASHPSLYHYFLVSPDPKATVAATGEDRGKRAQAGPGKIKHVEQLASFLVKSVALKDEENLHLVESILAFFATLSNANEDAKSSLLLMSNTLVPSIVLFLHNLSSWLWEERDDELIRDSARMTPLVDLISRTTSLLYYLLCSPPSTSSSISINTTTASQRPPNTPPPHQPSYDLNKFHSMTGPFNGIFHLYVLTFGRLSFGDTPVWLEGEEAKATYEHTGDMARELLELSMDVPELEMIWSAFQLDSDTGKTGSGAGSSRRGGDNGEEDDGLEYEYEMDAP